MSLLSKMEVNTMSVDLKKKPKSKIDLSKANFTKSEKEIDYGSFIKDKRVNVFKMSQEEFANAFSVQLGTLRNWEQNISSAPAYFIQLIKAEETNLTRDYHTQIERERLTNNQIMAHSSSRQFLSERALDLINGNVAKSQLYSLLNSIIGEEGILENLQTLSVHFDNYNAADIAVIMNTILLERIDSKLDTIVDYIKQE